MEQKQIIEEAIERVVMHGLGPDEKMPGFVVEHPADESHGDYATNVAMMMNGTPRELAQGLAEKLKKSEVLGEVVDPFRIEVAGPGFINFWLKDDYLMKRLEELKGLSEKCGQGDFMEGKKMLVDYSSPNIAKRFSVGHLRSTIIGQAICNLYKFSGAKVVSDNHLGDWGTQLGMIIAAGKEKNVDVSTAAMTMQNCVPQSQFGMIIAA